MTARAYALIDSYTYGFALREAALPFDGPQAVTAVADQMMPPIPAAEYPFLVEMATGHVLEPGYNFGNEFESGLNLILDVLTASLPHNSEPPLDRRRNHPRTHLPIWCVENQRPVPAGPLWHSRAVPNLDFYAVADDQGAVLEAIFGLNLFRVFEAYSEPDSQLREFVAAEEVPLTSRGAHLMLYAVESGPEPTAHRIELRPGGLGDATFRFQCQGWGIIQLHFGDLFQGDELRWSHTNHNTEKRAAKWAAVYPELGDPAAWEWAAVSRASSKLNRTIRSMAVGRIGSHPVLPQAAELIRRLDLKYEYGIGVHGTPGSGMTQPIARAF